MFHQLSTNKMPSSTQVTCCYTLLLTLVVTLTLGAPSPSSSAPPPPPTHVKFQAPQYQQHHNQQRTQPTVMNQQQHVAHTTHHHHQQPAQRQHNLGARLPPVVAQQQHQQHQQQNQTNQRHVAQQRVLTMCSVPDELKPYSRCLTHQELELKTAARSEFQSRLVETSSDLRQLLANYLLEFRSLSLGLVLVARNDTLVRLRQLPGPTQSQHDAIQLATRRLFEALYSHLLTYPHPDTADLSLLRASNNMMRVQQQQQQQPPTSGDIQPEINDYFRRLQLIHLKRALEELQPVVELDLDCLDRNLQSSAGQIDVIFDELASSSEARDSWRAVKVNQVRLGQALRQSVEFARTLLSSLNLASEMFANLTQRPDDWMPSDSCHLALTRMSVCQECHLTGGTSVGGNYLGAAPCENYCLNVARGCMNDLYELNRFWAEHVSSLARFKANMIQTNNLENVMSSLNVNLVDNLVGKLQQLQYSAGGDTAAPQQLDQLPASSELIKRCPRNHQAGLQNPSGPASGFAGFFKRAALAADLLQLPRAIPGRPASKMLPPTQQRPAEVQMSEAALRARQSPALSLFNRLDGLVLQLQETREFFADWPQQMCHRIRAHRDAQAGVSASQPHSSPGRRANSTECWNGRDFSGYSKPLAPFGLPISAGHPEVTTMGAQIISPLVLNLVARLKEIGTQLARKSHRAPIDLLSLTSSRVLEAATKSSKSAAGGPLAAARVSEEPSANERSASLIINDQADEQDHEAAASHLVQALATNYQQQQPQQPAKQQQQQPTSEDLDVAPDGEAAESEGDHEPDEQDEPLGDELDNSAAGSDELATMEGDNDSPECLMADCSDLLSSTSTSASSETEPQQTFNQDQQDNSARPVKPVVIVPAYPSYPNEILYTPPELTYTYPSPPSTTTTTIDNNNTNNNNNLLNHQNYQVAVGSGATSSSSLPAPLELLAGSLLLCLAMCLCYACCRRPAHRLANVRVAGQLGAK